MMFECESLSLHMKFRHRAEQLRARADRMKPSASVRAADARRTADLYEHMAQVIDQHRALQAPQLAPQTEEA